MKHYEILGSVGQMAAVETKSNLNLAKKILTPAKFPNGCAALRTRFNIRTQREARAYLNRANTSFAFICGRLGRWLTPTFVIVEITRRGQFVTRIS